MSSVFYGKVSVKPCWEAVSRVRSLLLLIKTIAEDTDKWVQDNNPLVFRTTRDLNHRSNPSTTIKGDWSRYLKVFPRTFLEAKGKIYEN